MLAESITTKALAQGVATTPSKELWEQVEEHLRRSYCPRAEFLVGEHLIQVQKVNISENRQGLAVYVDGAIKGEWFGFSGDEVPTVIPLVWRKRERSLYKPAERARLEKSFGKRRAREMFPNMDKKIVHHDPYFTTAKSLVTQFKRIDGIKLVRVGYDS